jgi:hypothetical protein
MNNNVTINYGTMSACNLTVGGVIVGAISGTGSLVTKITNAPGPVVVVCGSVNTTVQVINYTPAFTQSAFNGTSKAGVTVKFTTNGLSQQISYTGYTANTTVGILALTPPVGTYTVTLTTIGTNPILTATTIININPVATWSVLAQPASVQIGSQAQFRVQMQYIAQAYVTIFSSAGVLQATLYNPWTNTLNASQLQNVTFSYTVNVTGQFYFSVISGNLTLNSTTFTATTVPPPAPAANVPISGYYPNATTLYVGQNVTLKWTSTLAANLSVMVYLYKGNATTSKLIGLLGSTPNTG